MADRRGYSSAIGSLTLSSKLALSPDVIGALDDGRAVGLVVGVADRRPHPRATLDQDACPTSAEFPRAGRSEGDAVLVRLDFCDYADDHR